MEKLTTFLENDTTRLFILAKELDRRKSLEPFLGDNRYKLVSYIIAKDNFEIWRHFIEGNIYLKLIDDNDATVQNGITHKKMETGERSDKMVEEEKEKASTRTEDHREKNTNERLIGSREQSQYPRDNDYPLEEGDKSLNALSMYTRYLLWQKAVDYYFDSQELKDKNVEEVSTEYSLLDNLNNLPEDVNNNEATKSHGSPVHLRDEDDDYDMEDEEEPDNRKKESSEAETQGNNQTLKFNEIGQLVLEVPSNIFFEKNTTYDSTEMQGSVVDGTLSNIIYQKDFMKEYSKVYHNFEYDKETLIKRRKLEKSDMQLENGSSKDADVNKYGSDKSANATNNSNMEFNFGSASLSLQHLINMIQTKRDLIPLDDFELRTLFMDVRKNRGKWANSERVGQEELYEACEKVVLDLRGYTEHSTPFLNKVSKREAPNYSLIIKQPMDLNTVMKKLKNLQYNSKQEFVDDLMLIWSNCLTYNADPRHYLRPHAIAMQKRNLKLIPSIPDIVIRSRAEIEKEEELEKDDKGNTATGKGPKKSRTRTNKEDVKPDDGRRDSHDDSLSRVPRTEDSVAEEMSVSSENDAKQSNTFEQEIDDEDDDQDIENREESYRSSEDEDAEPELQDWKMATAKSRADYCSQRAALFDNESKLRPEAGAIVRDPNKMSVFKNFFDSKQVISKSNNLLENDEPYLLEYEVMGGFPGIRYHGANYEEEEKREQRLVDLYLQRTGGDTQNLDSLFALPLRKGLNKTYFDNIKLMQEIRKICFKISLIRQMQSQKFVHHTQMKPPEIEELKEVDVDPISRLPNRDSFCKEIHYSTLRRNICKIVMQTGYQSITPSAINTLTQIGEHYFGNLVKSLKLHLETSSSNKLTFREILLLSLLENGVDNPDDLYTFVKERVFKQQDKLKVLKHRLSNFLKDLLKPSLDNFNEQSFDDNSEQFITGDFSNELGEDFFGFKELGLDKEYQMLSSSIPIYLLYSKLQNNYSTSGNERKTNKYKDLEEFQVSYLHASDVNNQILLLTQFYNQLLEKSKAHYIKLQRKKGESTALPEDEKLLLIEDDELPQKQRNTRPRLPPNGKINSVKKKSLANAYILEDVEKEL